MTQNQKPSNNSLKRVQITPPMSVKKAQEIAFLTYDYYKHFKSGQTRPSLPLPDLRTMLLANTILSEYINQVPLNNNLELFNACLDPEIVTAVYCFINEPTFNLRIGSHQLICIIHPKT